MLRAAGADLDRLRRSHDTARSPAAHWVMPVISPGILAVWECIAFTANCPLAQKEFEAQSTADQA